MSSTKNVPPSQHLYQQVMQKYGWYAHYDTNEAGFWCLEIVVGLKSKWIVLEESTTKDLKQAKNLLASRALALLTEEITAQEALPVYSLTDVFAYPLPIYDSQDEATWKWFWEHPPVVVGIDVEGNQTSPPVLVQIATDEYVILEVPRGRLLSHHLVRLLTNDSITKVFCDNGSHKDKTCLGLPRHLDHSCLLRPPVVDLEVLFASLSGPTPTPRGLGKIMATCLALPPSSTQAFTDVLHVRIGKSKQTSQRMKTVGKFAMIEQGKRKPLQGLHDLSPREQQYAALDAWCTLQAYHRLVEFQASQAALVVALAPTRIMLDRHGVVGATTNAPSHNTATTEETTERNHVFSPRNSY